MASPTTAINRFDLSMSYGEFNLQANRKGFIGLRALPAIGVGLQSANFSKIKTSSMLGPIEDTLRAPKGTYKRTEFEWTTDSYATEDHGVEEIVDDRTIKMYGNEIKAEMIMSARARNRVLQALENAIAAAVFNTSTWTGAALTTGVSIPWNTAATATPITDVDNAVEKVKSSCGQRPNTLIITDYALRKMKRTAQIQDLLKYSGKDDPKDLSVIAGLKALLSLEQILVADGFKNTADEGITTPVFGRLWDITKAMVCHVNLDSMDLEDPTPCIGRTIMWNEENATIPGAESGDAEPALIIEEYREESRRGGVYRARMDRMIKVIHPEAGHLLTAVTS